MTSLLRKGMLDLGQTVPRFLFRYIPTGCFQFPSERGLPRETPGIDFLDPGVDGRYDVNQECT